MLKDKFELIAFIAGGVSTAIGFFIVWVKHLDSKRKDQTAGSRAILKIEATIDRLETDIKKLENKSDYQHDVIQDLKRDVRELINQITENFFGRNAK